MPTSSPTSPRRLYQHWRPQYADSCADRWTNVSTVDNADIFSDKRSDELTNTGAYEYADIFADECATARTNIGTNSMPAAVPTAGPTSYRRQCLHLSDKCSDALTNTGAHEYAYIFADECDNARTNIS